ncbi:hypothetical protein [Hathewaya histolytica]|uniref:hypothetical protein n=1 Tax=Hathewaya histolytica TaxID=1498 RepID=UPI0010FDAFD8
MLEYIKNVTKTGTITKKKNYNKNRHKNSHNLTIRYDAAITLLKEIEPYLIIKTKKERTEMILKNYKKTHS